jgi:GH24 family phage-related lysozyme (muramidase)
MNIKRIIREEFDDFEWMRGDIYFPIDFILGKQIYWRENNLDQIKKSRNIGLKDVNRGDLILGSIRRGKRLGWVVSEVLPNGDVTVVVNRGDTQIYTTEEVEQYVNLGMWVLVGDNGNILNDFSNKNLDDSEKILESLFNRISLLTEEGKTEPDMVWDFTKKDLDKSKRWVKTKEDVKEYLVLLLSKIKYLPKKIKIKVLKYVLISFFSIVGVKEMNNLIEKLPSEDIQLVMSQLKTPKKGGLNIKKTPQLKKGIRDYSDSLTNLVKGEEGLRLKAYKLGDGMVTIGYGHAEKKGQTELVPGKTTITKKESEILLKNDLEYSKKALNRILDSWDESGVEVEITQGMYDSMVSMIYNMGIGNFRRSDFIQLVKKGELDKASEEIKQTSSNLFNKYPGLKKRRNKEYKLFIS